MSRLVILSMFAIISAVAGQPTRAADNDGTPAQAKKANAMANVLRTMYSSKTLQDGVYVGSEFCIACHQDYSTWRDTKHAQALRRPMPEYTLMAGKGVVADYDENGVDDFMQGLDFNTISSVFDVYKPNAPVLSYADGSYFVTIGTSTMPVVCTQGGTGDWKQRYLLRVPVVGTADGYSAENYVSPIQFNEKTHAYVLYHPEAWYDAANLPRYDATTPVADLAAQNGRTYSKKCIGCHTTGVREVGQHESGEWYYKAFPAALFREDDPSYFDYDHDGITDIVNVGCEACHGPGSAHILGAGNPDLIVNPDELETAEANAVCGQCHSRTSSVPNGTHGWPYNDETGTSWIPGTGQVLADFFSDAAGRWPDGVTSRQHHQQYFDFLESSKPDFQFHPVKCVECHNSHGTTTNKHLIRDVIVDDGLEIATANDNDTLCLACHATHGDFESITKEMVADYETNEVDIGLAVSVHTKHPYAPERSMGLSRCSKCHNATTAKSAINYDVHSHTFEVISPEKTLAYQDEGGMPNSCAVSCHATKVNSFDSGFDTAIGTWDSATDVDLATELMKFFGPGGVWWDHSIDDTGEGKQGPTLQD